MDEKQKNILNVPMAIVVAGIIIGGAIFFSRGGTAKEIFKQPAQNDQTTSASISGDIAMKEIGQDDHIVGNPEAGVIMVEYSDLECPFCKSFHKTMLSLMDNYGKDGKLAWVYRHFPLDIHPKSPKESEAAECAAELAGNKGFWDFIDKVFEITPANNGLDPAKLNDIASQIGLDSAKFKTCLDSGKYSAKIKSDYADGLKAGVNGTPHTILVLKTPISLMTEKRLGEISDTIMKQLPPGSSSLITIDSSKKKIGISGAFQYDMMKEIIDMVI